MSCLMTASRESELTPYQILKLEEIIPIFVQVSRFTLDLVAEVKLGSVIQTPTIITNVQPADTFQVGYIVCYGFRPQTSELQIN